MSQINFPNSPSDGEEFLASNGTTYRYDSSTGQWKILSGPGVQGPAGNTGPTGSIIMWGTSTLPEGYIECNGQSTSGYTALAALYGSNVPDLRGEFVRGWDNGKGTDSGRALLGSQGESFKSHTHTLRIHTITVRMHTITHRIPTNTRNNWVELFHLTFCNPGAIGLVTQILHQLVIPQQPINLLQQPIMQPQQPTKAQVILKPVHATYL
ncbi:tail collar domain protein [Synechococcus phage ACG-2014f]|uniref:Tail collar domain protein n=1 Tax=Synechococcus phage ACG-2014f TaxID=1493511 RepID=A0A0E3I794_9CAUD|nr:tail collar domain protein [Synechococcus phage ACG-2014f]AIX43332.1 tail collar domain protein [Synechococcus phage ACG-2014f]